MAPSRTPEREKVPLFVETVPVLVPWIRIPAPTTGEPLASTTFPEMVRCCCALSGTACSAEGAATAGLMASPNARMMLAGLKILSI